ncbi:MAG: isoleucine--tRNA ligase [Candidatus Pacearchaeota archaeon]
MEEGIMKRNRIASNEEEILKFWEKNKIYEKLKEKNSRGKKFYFMDGPPYATGHIHMGTALNKILKDIVIRSQRLQGKDVFDRPGYDTHGVPIEFQVEKEIGSKSKKDIEKYGVDRFVEKCRDYATKYIDVMNNEFKNLGVWMDWDNPYMTLEDEYIEAIWDTLKTAYERGLLYLGKYPVHICPRCETVVAYNEIEYTKIEDTAVYVKFQNLKDNKKFFIIFTTTPWTLPGNTGIMINPDIIYCEVKVDEETWIIAKPLVTKVMKLINKDYQIIKEVKGKEMENEKYINPIAKFISVKLKDSSKNYRVILSARYVNVEEGTGLVHCAPGHGKEDYEAGKEAGLEMISPVKMNGELTEEAGKYSGRIARIVDEEIIEDLENENRLVYKTKYLHDYPICWRCKSPLLMISVPQWFLRISEIKRELIKKNEEINWVPKWMKLRMKAWLDGISDWPISRDRYWGTPLPIWISEDEKDNVVIGSIEELKKLSGRKQINIHKPWIDEITFEYNGKMMRRVPFVLDVWFDSGVSSWAALDYPKNQNRFKKFWPADLNIEGKDQIRGWWNSQLILSEVKFKRKPFESISVHGMVLDLGKRKMSKSLGNIISPHEIIEKYGRDYLRYYFAKISKGEDFSFDEEEFKEIGNFMRVFININNFVNQIDRGRNKREFEDLWILSRYHSMIKDVKNNYDTYYLTEVVQRIEDFVINDLSKTYIKIIRDRSEECYKILNEIRISLIKLLSPITPFICEKIWQELRASKIVKEESVHLSKFPEFKEDQINEELESDFSEAIKIIELGRSERDKIKIGLKWPLASATIYTRKDLPNEIKELIMQQLQVKKIFTKKSDEVKVEFDTNITEELEAEGYARNLSRFIQDMRKKNGLTKKEKIELIIVGDEKYIKLLENEKKRIKNRTNSVRITLSNKEMNFFGFSKGEVEIKKIFFKIFFRKV